MKRKTYPMHTDFKRWARVNPPLNKVALPIIQKLLGALYYREKSSDAVSVRRITIPVNDGVEIRALLYECANAEESLPCLMYFHGGGYVLPAAPYQYALAREYAQRLNCKVLFVDYRLAPKYSFPAAPEDCYAAYCYAINHSAEIDIDKTRVSVIGDSAGACLATVVCMMANERGDIMPRCQVLTYPAVGLDFDTESMREYIDTPMCNSADARKYDKLYIQDKNAGKAEYYAPINADILSYMPPAYIETAQFDCLRDSGILYAEKLEKQGVTVELHNTKGTIHGFDIVLDSPIVKKCVERRIEFMRKYFCSV